MFNREFRSETSSGLSHVLWLALLAGALIMFLIVLGFALEWFAAPFETMSPERVRILSQQANDEWGALEQTRTGIERLRGQEAEFITLYGTNTAVWPQGKAEEYQQVTAARRNREAQYDQLCATYEARWADEWRDLPAPDDLPRQCPALPE